MKTQLKYARKFIGSDTISAASWELYKDDASGQKLCGCFRLAWKTGSVVIHSLDLESDSVEQFYIKVRTIADLLQDFMYHLKGGIKRIDRGWLNPVETGATGSFAYCVTDEPVEMVYFELASCHSKLRIYQQDFDHRESMLVTLSELRSFIMRLLKAMEDLMQRSH